MKGFCTLGICSRCGDTEGPWGLYDGRWLCDRCGEMENEKNVNQGEEDNERPGTDEENS